MNLDSDDHWHFQIAAGWLGLGDWRSANAELDKLTPTMQEDPEVLKLRVAIYCEARQFELAAAVSDALAQTISDDAQFWFNRGVALCQLGRLQEAEAAIFNCLQIKPELFPAVQDNPDLKLLSFRSPSAS